VDREDIIDQARKWLGTKWMHQGRTEHGIDCVGLIVVVGKSLGAICYDKTDYQRRPNGYDFMACFNESGLINKKPREALEGDILIFRESAYPCHTGFLSIKKGKKHIIHAHLLRRKVVEEPFISPWSDKVVACFSLTQEVN
jgi:cell wall-associated NlpC family hydrolase